MGSEMCIRDRYESDLDDIVGIVYLKDIIPALSGEDDGAKTAADFMQPVLYVPETMRCSELLRQFKEKKQRMAVVVDEYGGTEGLVTMEDLLEAIVGKIDDGHDEEGGIVQLSENCWELDGEAEVDDVEHLLGSDLFENDDSETLNGFITNMLGRIPAQGEVNRAHSEEIQLGGKGINVSRVLSELGEASTALGFIAGFTGDALQQGLRAMGLHTDFVRLKSGATRINVKLKAQGETDINATGPAVDETALAALLQKLDALGPGDMLVLAGSVPAAVPADIYKQILARLQPRGVPAVVDAEKELLAGALAYRPFLVKPNHLEPVSYTHLTLPTT